MIGMTTYRGVIFDFFGTLTPDLEEADVAVSLVPVAKHLGADPAAFFREMKSSWVERCTGQLGGTEATLLEVARRAGSTLEHADSAAAVLSRLTSFELLSHIRPEVPEILFRLRREGLKLGVISDCGPELVDLWPRLPVADMVDVTVLSAAVGAKKPDPILFGRACDGLNLGPRDCMYVGDGGSNELLGAADAGLSPVWLRPKLTGNQYVYDFKSGEGGMPTIDSLAAVLPLVLSGS